MELTNEVPDDMEVTEIATGDLEDGLPPISEAEKKHVKTIQDTVRSDKLFHEAAFKIMRRDMFIARKGYDPKTYPGKTSYVANICGRHVKQKTAALYAKNPKAVARRDRKSTRLNSSHTPVSRMPSSA